MTITNLDEEFGQDSNDNKHIYTKLSSILNTWTPRKEDLTGFISLSFKLTGKAVYDKRTYSMSAGLYVITPQRTFRMTNITHTYKSAMEISMGV